MCDCHMLGEATAASAYVLPATPMFHAGSCQQQVPMTPASGQGQPQLLSLPAQPQASTTRSSADTRRQPVPKSFVAPEPVLPRDPNSSRTSSVQRRKLVSLTGKVQGYLGSEAGKGDRRHLAGIPIRSFVSTSSGESIQTAFAFLAAREQLHRIHSLTGLEPAVPDLMDMQLERVAEATLETIIRMEREQRETALRWLALAADGPGLVLPLRTVIACELTFLGHTFRPHLSDLPPLQLPAPPAPQSVTSSASEGSDDDEQFAEDLPVSEGKWVLGNHPEATDMQAMIDMLFSNKAAFAHDLDEVPGNQGSPIEFPLIDQQRNMFAKQCQYTAEEFEFGDGKVKEMLQSGIVVEVPTTNQYVSCITLPLKGAPDGSWTNKKFCIDLRDVNANITVDHFGLPLPEEIFRRIAGAKFLAKIDMRAGFWQIRLSEQAKQLTAFSGVADTFEAHLRQLDVLFKHFVKVGLRAHPAKTVVAAQTIGYLGHLISATECQPEEAKVAAIKALEPPTSVKRLQAHLGLFNYYRAFVPGFSRIAQPLYKLTAKDVVWEWIEACQQAFDGLKDVLCTHGLALRQPADPFRPFHMFTNWSQTGLAVVLQQKTDDDTQEPLLCAADSTGAGLDEHFVLGPLPTVLHSDMTPDETPYTQRELTQDLGITDFSLAGPSRGMAAARSRLLSDLVRLIGVLQQLLPEQPPGYLLENVPMQFHKNSVISQQDFQQVTRAIGQPVVLDAAQLKNRRLPLSGELVTFGRIQQCCGFCRLGISTAIDPRITEDTDAVLCEVCGTDEQEDKLILCDICTRGYRVHVPEPPVMAVATAVQQCLPSNVQHAGRFASISVAQSVAMRAGEEEEFLDYEDDTPAEDAFVHQNDDEADEAPGQQVHLGAGDLLGTKPGHP
eukprot:gene15177-biopygen2069